MTSDALRRLRRNTTDCADCGAVTASNHLTTMDAETVTVCEACCPCCGDTNEPTTVWETLAARLSL